ncbi:LysM peptidoglycan-binding domain-containing protein [Entomospira entomophila]|uniref:LysM peptidoglycan-binding domain-containing protein n=1 Tax=Entomospira entomophila TaxID=2719988 RepID=A0A968GAB2_9SPIO|nr:LysM peptidoglycan-binding domain-containing protein [Entomospira entomophilus]NIZ40705.1 LysM peptidoglycan-binding domain-containing protein [Entomospira entomophilus]WDI34918.1 LysM peptidoglycan-binding domain-containing protein [Entomospira entomophilus]
MYSRRIFTLLISFVFMASFGFAQSLEDNPYFKRSIELRILSQEALARGDYDAAYKYAEEGLKELDKFETINSLMLAEQRMNTARQRGLHTQDPEKFAEIAESVELAKASLQDEDFNTSKAHSEHALTLLDDLMRNAQQQVETYTVVRGDSLWRIAGRPSIYGDPFAWPRIYMANKHRLRYPDNPDLIYPGQVFDIPR